MNLFRLALVAVVVCSGLAGAEEAAVQRLLVGGYHGSIARVDLSPAGALSAVSAVDGGPSPSFVAVNRDGTAAYAVNEGGPGGGGVRAFRIGQDGRLVLLGMAASGGAGPCNLALHPGGKWLLTANYGSGHVGVLPIREDGTVGAPSAAVKAGEHAHMVLIDSGGVFVFVPCLGSDHIAQYRFDAGTGALTPNDPPTVATPTGSGPRYLAMVDDSVYCVNERDSSIGAFALDRTHGTLSQRGPPVSLLPAGFTGKNTGGHCAISPDGRFVYASNRGHDSIAIFARDHDSGALTLIGHEAGGGEIRTPRHFAFSPGGSWLVVASQDAALLTLFAVDRERGLLRRVASLAVDAMPSAVAFLPVR
jgi:6-phosphogluconolactonase